jgi:peptidoglycan/LPS O-acetylase OafA/YrhL
MLDISIFMLDLYNITIMKAKVYLIFVIAGSLTIMAGIWAYYSIQGSFVLTDLFQFLIIGLLIIFALFLGIRRISSERRGLPAEDELSKKVIQKAAGTAYYISLYMWLVISYLADSRELANHTWIGIGIVCMAILFAGSWLYHNYNGIQD